MPPMPITSRISHKIANMGIVCAFLVVGLHCRADFACGSAVSFVWQVLVFPFSSIAVPFFFVISGFLLAGHMHERNWWLHENIKRIRSLLVPYVCVCIVFVLLELSLNVGANLMHHLDVWRNVDLNGGYWLRAFGLDLRFNPIDPPLWFLRALFVLVVFSFLVMRMANGIGVLILAFAYVCSCLCFVNVDNDNWVCRECLVSFDAVKALFYFTAGVFLRLCKPCLFSHSKRILIYSLAIITFIGVAFLSVAGASYRWRAICLFVPFWGYVVFDLMPERKWPKELTSLAFPIYVFHIAFIRIFGEILKKVPPFVGDALKQSLTAWLLYYGIIIVATVSFVILLRWFMPRISRVFLGGR